MNTGRMFSVMALALLCATSLPLWADSEVRIVRLSLVDGPVQLDRATGQGFEKAITNMPITNGMQLWTRGDSRAEIEFEEGSTLRATPGTRIDFSQLILRDDGTRATALTIGTGRAYVDYAHKKGEDFRVIIGNQELVLYKPVHFRVDVVGDRAEIAVFSGELHVGPEKVKKNNTAILYLSDGRVELAKGIAPAMEDRWDDYRASYHDTYARSNYNSRFYGRSDLNYFGGWYNTGYGSCWRPNGFDLGWSPYSSGAWAWYPGYGYTWVSLYPWGWQPYRSGAWNYAGGLGWCWTPSRRYYGLGWAPVYNAPSSYTPPQPPNQVTRVPTGRDPRGVGIVPVGNVDTTGNWRSTDRIMLDRGFRGRRNETSGVVTGGVNAGGVRTGVVTSSGTASGTVNADRSSRSGRDITAPVSTPPMDRADRALQRDMQREQQQIQREMRVQRGERSIDRSMPSSAGSFGGGQRSSVPSPSPGPAPRVSAPPPAPAPVHTPAPAPSSRESRGNVPKQQQ